LVARAGRLDLDDICPEVGKDRRSRRSGDPARAVDYLQARKQALCHGMLSFLLGLPPSGIVATPSHPKGRYAS